MKLELIIFYYLIKLLLFNNVCSWGNFKNLWKTGQITKKTVLDSGRIQFLSLKKMGKCISYYNIEKREVVIKSATLNQTNLITPKDYVVDVDVELWNENIYNMIAFYDKKLLTYKVETSYGVSILSKSPINRCFLYEYSNDTLIGLIVINSGEIHKINRTSTECIHQQVTLPTFVSISEYYSPYLYIVDSYNVIHIFCPRKTKVIFTLDLEYKSPIVHFFVHATLTPHEYHITVGLLDKTVHSFYIHRGVIRETSQLTLKMKHEIKKVYCDEYKCMIILENESLVCYDSINGDFWFDKEHICDANYITRFHCSHQSFIVDGTYGLKFYNVKNINDDDMSQLNDMTKWITNTPSSPFLNALMKSPPYHKTHQQGNWSWSLDDEN